MGRQRIEIHIQAVTGKEREATRGEHLSQGVNKRMGHVLRAGTELKDGEKLGARINCQPQPEHPCRAAEPCTNFVQLQVWDVQVAEGALVQGLRVLASTGQPGADGGLPVAEDPFGGGSIQPFGECREHYGDLLRGSFQPVEGSIAPGSEGGVAGETSECLDVLGLAVLAIPDEGVELSVGVSEVPALRVGTGEAVGVHALGCSSPAFHLAPGLHRSSRWPSCRRGWGGETTGGAIVWAARPKETVQWRTSAACLRVGRSQMLPAKTPQQHQGEDEEEQKQERVHMKAHKNPHYWKSVAEIASVS